MVEIIGGTGAVFRDVSSLFVLLVDDMKEFDESVSL